MGAIVVVSKADAISSRLIQTASMLISGYPLYILQGREDFSEGNIALKGIDRSGVRTCLFYMPLAAIPLPMIITGVNSINTGWVLATLLFTLSVGMAKELHLRGIILRLLGESLDALPVAFISLLIFGAGHASGAFVEISTVMVLLTILNAFLFGWVANSVSEQLYDSAKQRIFTLLGWRREFWMVMKF